MSVVIIQEGFYSMRYKNGERGSHSDFFVALIRRAVAIVAIRKRDVPVPQSPGPDYNRLWVDGGPCVFR